MSPAMWWESRVCSSVSIAECQLVGGSVARLVEVFPGGLGEVAAGDGPFAMMVSGCAPFDADPQSRRSRRRRRLTGAAR